MKDSRVYLIHIREKIDAAIAISKQTPPMDGKAFVGQILKDLQQVRERQQSKVKRII